MKKKAIVSFLGWLSILLVLFVLAIGFFSSYALAAAIAWVCLLLFSVGLNFYNKRFISVRVKIPATMGKKEKAEGKIIIKNSGRFPVGCIYCRVSLQNRLTGEKKEEWLRVSAVSKGSTEKSFQFESAYCGYIYVQAEELVLMEWFGFLPVRVKEKDSRRISVLPDTFSVDAEISVSAAASSDSDAWSQTVKGNDHTEVFGLREYVPGDSLKQIHWKLSSKLNQLIVKEPSLPTEKSLLLFWDKNTAAASGAEMDAMAEVVASVAQALESQGILYKLGWTEGRAVVLEDVENQDQLLTLIPRMIKSGTDLEAGSGVSLYMQSEKAAPFGKVIYFGKEILEDMEGFPTGEMVLILCGSQQHNYWNTINYTSETYMEDLQMIEL